jgi:NAD(P)-dependent dehydrogenase (short-subunit alcohol dehydrogenase family)
VLPREPPNNSIRLFTAHPEHRQQRGIFTIFHPIKVIEDGNHTQGHAGDLANAIVFLASDQASWITGQRIKVDGGCGYDLK